jgi:tRNA G37 N-methylase TrmD
MAIERTKERRPDLLSKATLSPDELSRLNTLDL